MAIVEIVVPDEDGEEALKAVEALLAADDFRSPGLEMWTECRLQDPEKT